jgi:hypothetical protein
MRSLSTLYLAIPPARQMADISHLRTCAQLLSEIAQGIKQQKLDSVIGALITKRSPPPLPGAISSV